MGPGNGSDAVPASIPLGPPHLVERLLLVAGYGESWWQLEAVDVDSDGEIDLLRIHLVNLINGDTFLKQIGLS